MLLLNDGTNHSINEDDESTNINNIAWIRPYNKKLKFQLTLHLFTNHKMYVSRTHDCDNC